MSTFLKSMMAQSVAFAQNWGILQTRMDQRWDHMKISFYGNWKNRATEKKKLGHGILKNN